MQLLPVGKPELRVHGTSLYYFGSFTRICFIFCSLWRTTSLPKRTAIGRRSCWMGRKCRSISWIQPGRRTTLQLETTTFGAGRVSCVSSPLQKWNPLQPQPTSGVYRKASSPEAVDGQRRLLARLSLCCRWFTPRVPAVRDSARGARALTCPRTSHTPPAVPVPAASARELGAAAGPSLLGVTGAFLFGYGSSAAGIVGVCIT